LINTYSEYSVIKSLTRHDDRRFPFLGLVNLIDDLMIMNVKQLTLANEIGFKKLTKNSIALQQNLKSVLLDTHLNPTPTDREDIPKDRQLDPTTLDPKSSLTIDLSFERCRKFWEIASKGPQVSDPV
jgi:hypothetical protein